MSEYIIKLPNGGAVDECIRLRGYEKSLYGYELHEEIMRCRDCKYHEYLNVSYSDKLFSVCLSEQWIGAEGDNPLVEPDGFCAWGERK